MNSAELVRMEMALSDARRDGLGIALAMAKRSAEIAQQKGDEVTAKHVRLLVTAISIIHDAT